MDPAVLLVFAALAYAWWVRRWPWQDCRWCGGKGRYKRQTLITRQTVYRDCTHCAGGVRRRMGAGTKPRRKR